MSETFKPGDHVVHAVHGPGRVVGVEIRDTPGGAVEYVSMEVENMRIMIPTSELEQVGVRTPISREDAEAILEQLGEEGLDDPGHTARRRRNKARLAGGDAEALAQVVRSLRTLREERDKGLALRDRSHLISATTKLVGELAIALGVEEEEARELIEAALHDTVAGGGD